MANTGTCAGGNVESIVWRENEVDAFDFFTVICFGAKANSFYGILEIVCANF